MVDINTATSDLGSNVASGVNTGFIWVTIIVLLLGIIGLIVWRRYVKSFNHMVVIKRPVPGGGFELDHGYKGRFVFKRSKNDDSKKIIFQIYQARKRKISYNEESDAYSHRIASLVNGVRRYMIIMEPDSEGFLHPVQLVDKTDRSMEAVLKQADLASYEAELKIIADKYDQPDFMGKYGLLIYIILILVVAALFWWGTRNNAAAMEMIANAVSSQAVATSEMTRLTEAIINGSAVKPAPPVIIG